MDASRVLVIDDSVVVRSWVELELFGAGFSVHSAPSGEDALKVTDWFQPDVVLCDMNMPGMNGLDVVRAFQKRDPLTPVVIYTDSQNIPVAVEALRYGASGYVVKDEDPTLLRRELDTALQHRNLKTRQKVLEQANAKYQRELEQMVAEKTREIERLQQIRAQAEKMAALGTVAAGVAHEINNPLAVVLANLRWMSTSANDPTATAEEQRIAMAEAIQCAERIQRIVVDLRRTVHPGSKPQGACNVRDAVQEAMTVAREQAHSAVHVDVSKAPEGVIAAMDRDALVTVVSNLVVNAAHAVEGLAAGRIWVTVEQEGPKVLVRVQDNGTGIRPEHLARVRDPFFTTKAPGRGTGLGLSLVDRIVREAQGELHIDSTLGAGTSIAVTLPVIDTASVSATRH